MSSSQPGLLRSVIVIGAYSASLFFFC